LTLGASKSPASSWRSRSSVSSVVATESAAVLPVAAGLQPVGQLAVQAAQVHSEQAGRRGDQRFPHPRFGHVFGQRGLQCAHEHVGAQRIQARLDRAPAEQGADQRIELRQHVVHRQRNLLLRACHLDALIQLGVAEQLQVLVAQQLAMELLLAAALIDDPRQLALEGFADRLAARRQVAHRLLDAFGLEAGHPFRAGEVGRALQAGQHVPHQQFGMLQHRSEAVVQVRLQCRRIVGNAQA
jgi:hypothetical protein